MTPNDRQAGVEIQDEVEITSEMVEAGVEVFLANYPDSGTGDRLDRNMVVGIYDAMRKARGI